MSVRTIAFFIAALVFGFSATAAFAEYDHCYVRTPPGNAQKSSPELAKKTFGLEYGLVPVLYRKACNLTNADDFAHVRALYGHLGCTPESDLGRDLERVLTVAPSDVEGLEGLEQVIAGFPALYAEFCSLVAELPWPEVDQEFNPLPIDESRKRDVLQSIEELTERAREASPELGR